MSCAVQLCSKLATARDAKGEIIIPTFENPNKEQKPLDFRRLLLSKCQSEFEKGIEADTRVKAREEQETKGGTEVHVSCCWNFNNLNVQK
jgi:hypothetical protein